MKRLKTIFNNLAIFLLALLILGQSTVRPANPAEKVRAYTRMIEFDFIDWTIDALLEKNTQEAMRAPRYMTVEEQRQVVFEYLRLVRWVNRTTAEARIAYADPALPDHSAAVEVLNARLEILKDMEASVKPLAESVLQYQVSDVIVEMDLGFAGQPVPPVLYHITRLPDALIVSPRNAIRQDVNISLVPELTPEEIETLEQQVEQGMDVSALVVPVGGIGIYPTMVMSSTDLNWLAEVVAHEWIHNYLTMRPLGLNYMTSPELRTINETTANIAGKEIGEAVIRKYYPELAPPPVAETPENQAPALPVPEDPDAFNFRREMRNTRLRVDELLAQGKVEEAEAYMEAQRRMFWDNGYRLRRLNQAYFAFYGAYDDLPGGGAAGSDPVGPAVQTLRKQSSSLAEFVNRIAWVTSFEALLNEVERAGVQDGG